MQQKTSASARRYGDGPKHSYGHHGHQRSNISQPRFRNEIVFPEQENQCESSTAYDTNGPGPTAVRHRLAGIVSSSAAVSPSGGAGQLQNASTLVGVGGHGGGEAATGDVGVGPGGVPPEHSVVGRNARSKDVDKTEFTPGTCMALSGRGDDLLFFEAGLQEYFYRNALATAILRIMIALSTSILSVCLLHNAIYFGFACARFVLDESIVGAFSVFERHPILTWTRWVSFSWAGIASFVVLIVSVAAKRSARLQDPENIAARMNQQYLSPQFGMFFEAHTDTLNVVRRSGAVSTM